MMHRPLPRLHALTDARVAAREDLGVRAAAIAAAGSAVALHARDRGATADGLVALARRLQANARPPEASVIVNARPDVAAAVHAQGVQVGAQDLAVGDARRVLGTGWVGASVHGLAGAEMALADGADYLLFGNIWETATHPDRPGAGLAQLTAIAALGAPVIALGGVTVARAAEARDAGAWGVAAISALWDAPDSHAAACAMLAPWASEGAA